MAHEIEASTRPIRALYIDTVTRLAGGQYALVEILKFLDPSEVTPILAVPASSDLRKWADASGIEWIDLPFASAHLGPGTRSGPTAMLASVWNALYGCAYLAVKARRLRVDIIHANTFKAGLVAAVAAALARKPLVFHDRTLFGHMPLGFFVALASKRLIVISEAVRAKYGGLCSSRMRLVPDSVDVDRFTPGAPSRGKRVAYLGRISEEKGIIHLVRAAPRLLGRVPDAEIVIAGSPFTREGARYLEKLEAEVRDLGLGSRLKFVGYVEDALSFLRGIDVLVLPSDKEGMGRVLLEAMALAKPVVAFDRGGPREVISDGTDGLLIPPGDDAALADAVASLLEDPALADRIGSEGRRTVVGRHASRALARAVVEVYSEICPEAA